VSSIRPDWIQREAIEMTENEGRGPGDLGEAAMPDTERRNPPTQHGETASPGDLDTTGEEEEEGIGDKVKDAMGGVIGKAKGMFGGDKE
jgi:hypothetical protein